MAGAEGITRALASMRELTSRMSESQGMYTLKYICIFLYFLCSSSEDNYYPLSYETIRDS